MLRVAIKTSTVLTCALAFALAVQSAPGATAQAASQATQERPAEDIAALDDEALARRMVAFIGDFYLSGQNLEPEELEAIYAPTVLYFGSRPKSRRAIVADKLGYYRRWPDRRYNLVPDTVSIFRTDDNAQQIDITFDYDFDVRSARRVSRGRGSAVLTLDLGVPGGQIVREDGKVVRRGS